MLSSWERSKIESLVHRRKEPTSAAEWPCSEDGRPLAQHLYDFHWHTSSVGCTLSSLIVGVTVDTVKESCAECFLWNILEFKKQVSSAYWCLPFFKNTIFIMKNKIYTKECVCVQFTELMLKRAPMPSRPTLGNQILPIVGAFFILPPPPSSTNTHHLNRVPCSFVFLF